MPINVNTGQTNYTNPFDMTSGASGATNDGGQSEIQSLESEIQSLEQQIANLQNQLLPLLNNSLSSSSASDSSGAGSSGGTKSNSVSSVGQSTTSNTATAQSSSSSSANTIVLPGAGLNGQDLTPQLPQGVPPGGTVSGYIVNTNGMKDYNKSDWTYTAPNGQRWDIQAVAYASLPGGASYNFSPLANVNPTGAYSVPGGLNGQNVTVTPGATGLGMQAPSTYSAPIVSGNVGNYVNDAIETARLHGTYTPSADNPSTGTYTYSQPDPNGGTMTYLYNPTDPQGNDSLTVTTGNGTVIDYNFKGNGGAVSSVSVNSPNVASASGTTTDSSATTTAKVTSSSSSATTTSAGTTSNGTNSSSKTTGSSSTNSSSSTTNPPTLAGSAANNYFDDTYGMVMKYGTPDANGNYHYTQNGVTYLAKPEVLANQGSTTRAGEYAGSSMKDGNTITLNGAGANGQNVTFTLPQSILPGGTVTRSGDVEQLIVTQGDGQSTTYSADKSGQVAVSTGSDSTQTTGSNGNKWMYTAPDGMQYPITLTSDASQPGGVAWSIASTNDPGTSIATSQSAGNSTSTVSGDHGNTVTLSTNGDGTTSYSEPILGKDSTSGQPTTDPSVLKYYNDTVQRVVTEGTRYGNAPSNLYQTGPVLGDSYQLSEPDPKGGSMRYYFKDASNGQTILSITRGDGSTINYTPDGDGVTVLTTAASKPSNTSNNSTGASSVNEPTAPLTITTPSGAVIHTGDDTPVEPVVSGTQAMNNYYDNMTGLIMSQGTPNPDGTYSFSQPDPKNGGNLTYLYNPHAMMGGQQLTVREGNGYTITYDYSGHGGNVMMNGSDPVLPMSVESSG